jgi:transketolase
MKTRNGYAEALIELAKQKEDVIALSADTAEKAGIKEFAQKYPDRFVQCGKAAQSMAAIAAGMALEDKIAFATGCITLGKNWDQIRTIAHEKLNVKIVDSDNTYEDLALARALPGMTVIVPADENEAKKATLAAGTMKGPVYIKLAKGDKITAEKNPFTIGRAEILRAGKDCTILACGKAVAEAMLAAERLSKQEIECTVLNCHTIQPIDKHAILASARLTGCMVTAEEGRALGSAAAEALVQNNPVPVRMSDADQNSIMRAVKEAVLLRCETLCPEIPEEHGRILASRLAPELQFRLHGGGVIKSVPELAKALLEMSNETFSHHCNDHKNDFSNWVKEVFKEPHLAQQMEKSKTRTGMALAITRWLS